MGIEVVNAKGEVLLNLPVDLGRIDLTAVTPAGFQSSNAYQIGPAEGQWSHVKLVVSELDAPPERLSEFKLQPVEWDGFTNEELQSMLRRNELEVSGNKDELIERLEGAGIRPIGAA